MNVAVWSARTAQPRTSPVSASSPLGTSSASTGTPSRLMAATSSAYLPSRSRLRPIPNRPSMTRSQRTFSGMRSSVLPPHSRHASSAIFASAASADWSPANTTSTLSHHALRWRATTKASPPLLPGPAMTSTPRPRLAATSRAICAAARPARSISAGAGDALSAAASMSRISAVRYTGNCLCE